MKRRKFEVPKKQGFALQLTSMVDMFTILLVFLLKTYSSDPYIINPHEGIDLPVSSTEQQATEAMHIVITTKGLYLDKSELAGLEDAKFRVQDLDANDPDFIKPLFAALDLKAKEQDSLGEEGSESIKKGEVILQADSKLSYQMLRKVMYTASMAGFPKLSMATISAD